jgi:RimJ/RimL family protein N-acetyltransferase
MTNAELAAKCIGLESYRVGDVLLRPFRAADIDALHAIISSRDDMTWERVKATPEYSRDLLAYRLEQYSKYGFGVMAIENPQGLLVGQGGLQVLHDVAPGEIELVVFLSPQQIGKGLGRTIGEFFIKASRECGISELYATVRHENAAAEQWIKKIGFEFERETTHFRIHCGLWRADLGNARKKE